MEDTMDTYFTGQILRITAEFRDNAEELADPTDLVFGYRVDQGALTTYTYGVGNDIQRNGVGEYYVDLSLAAGGTYAYQFKATGLIENTIEDAFLVLVALAVTPLVELTTAKDFLRVSDTDEDGLIAIILGGIEATIKENLSNYIIAQETTIYLDGNTEVLQLPRVPVSEEDGEEVVVYDDIYENTVDTDMYRLVPAVGQLFYKNEAKTWPEGKKRYRVTYTSGFSLRDNYVDVISRIKLAELTWLSDIYYNRPASVTKETIDEVSQWYDMTKDMPKNIQTLLQGLLDVYSDF